MALLDASLQIQAVLAMLAAMAKKPDALERGDALAQQLLDQGAWSFIDLAAYKGKTPEARIAWWASGAPLQLPLFTEDPGWGPQISGGVLDQAIIDKVRGLYEQAYGVFDVTPNWLADLAAKATPPPADSGSSAWPWIVGAVVVVGGGVGVAIAMSRSAANKRGGNHKPRRRHLAAGARA